MVVVVLVLLVVVVSVVVLVEVVLEMGWTAAALRAYTGERTLVRSICKPSDPVDTESPDFHHDF